MWKEGSSGYKNLDLCFYYTKMRMLEIYVGWGVLFSLYLLLHAMSGCGQQLSHSELLLTIHWSLQQQFDTHMGSCLPNPTGHGTSPLYWVWLCIYSKDLLLEINNQWANILQHPARPLNINIFEFISEKNLHLFQRLITQYTIKLNKWSRRLTSIQALLLLSLLQHKPRYNHLVNNPWITKEFSDHSVDAKCSPLLAKHFVNWVKHVLKTSANYCLKLCNDILEESSKQWKGKKFEQIGEMQNADLRPSQMPSQMQQPSLKQMCLSLFQDCKLHILQKQKNQRCIWIKKWTKEHGIVHGQSFKQHWTCPYIFLEAF